RGSIPKTALDATSNAGWGMVSVDEIISARRDLLDLQFGRFKSVRDMALGRIGSSREQVVSALGRFPREDNLALLNRFLESDNADERAGALTALSKLAEDWPPATRRFQDLQYDDVLVKRMTEIDSHSGEPVLRSAINEAKELLLHPNSRVRWAAVLVLA